MTYDECPQCGDNHAVRYDGETLECRSCRTPLKTDWLSDNWTIHESFKEAP